MYEYSDRQLRDAVTSDTSVDDISLARPRTCTPNPWNASRHWEIEYEIVYFWDGRGELDPPVVRSNPEWVKWPVQFADFFKKKSESRSYNYSDNGLDYPRISQRSCESAKETARNFVTYKNYTLIHRANLGVLIFLKAEIYDPSRHCLTITTSLL